MLIIYLSLGSTHVHKKMWKPGMPSHVKICEAKAKSTHVIELVRSSLEHCEMSGHVLSMQYTSGIKIIMYI